MQVVTWLLTCPCCACGAAAPGCKFRPRLLSAPAAPPDVGAEAVSVVLLAAAAVAPPAERYAYQVRQGLCFA